MEEKVREMVEMKQRSLAEDSQKTLEALKDRYCELMVTRNITALWSSCFQCFFFVWSIFFLPLVFHGCRERALQDQLRQATESVKNMQKLHESAQSQLFELRTQSGYFYYNCVTLKVFVTWWEKHVQRFRCCDEVSCFFQRRTGLQRKLKSIFCWMRLNGPKHV